MFNNRDDDHPLLFAQAGPSVGSKSINYTLRDWAAREIQMAGNTLPEQTPKPTLPIPSGPVT
jgi:hypothetical protein